MEKNSIFIIHSFIMSMNDFVSLTESTCFNIFWLKKGIHVLVFTDGIFTFRKINHSIVHWLDCFYEFWNESQWIKILTLFILNSKWLHILNFYLLIFSLISPLYTNTILYVYYNISLMCSKLIYVYIVWPSGRSVTHYNGSKNILW